ncbi:MAG: hypothetical protein U0798_20950 [Gemmataceae bacterium]
MKKIATEKVVMIVSLLIAFFSLLYAYIQTNLTKEANDRAAGRIGAKLELIRMEPNSSKFKHLFQPVHPGGDESVAHFQSVDELLTLSPGVTVKNTGDEIIESLRIETKELIVYNLEPGKKNDVFPIFRPIMEPVQREDYILSEKFKPGETAFVHIGKPLTKTILQAQEPGKPDWKHYTIIEVRCYGKVAGSPTYERAKNGSSDIPVLLT